jgi:hypothetical protein
MATATAEPIIAFPEGYDARAEFETPARGYLTGVTVQLEDGSRFELSFFDPIRLEQDLAAEVKTGRAYFTEPNLVILPEVTTESIKKAVQGLWRDGLFQRLRPL